MGERDSRASWATSKGFSNDVPPDYIYIAFKERSLGNKVCRGIYSLARCFNIVLMFYFAPQIGLFFSYEVPYLASGYWWQTEKNGGDSSNNMVKSVADIVHRSYLATDEYFFGDAAWGY